MPINGLDDRLNDHARDVLRLARHEAQRLRCSQVETEHLLLGLLNTGGSVGLNAIKNLVPAFDQFRAEVARIVTGCVPVATAREPDESPSVRKVRDDAVEEARKLFDDFLGSEHLLLGLMRDCETASAQLLLNRGLTIDAVRQEVLSLRGEPQWGTLSGQVVAPDGVPVPRARVWTSDYAGPVFAETCTDDDGRFRLGPLVPLYRPSFDLLIDAKGFARQYVRERSFSVFPGFDFDLGVIVLDGGRIFSGQLLDEDGSPLPAIPVECQSYRMALGHTFENIGAPMTAVTDQQGCFRTAPMPIGKVYIKVRVAERQMAFVLRNVLADGQEEIPPLRLQRDVPIRGVVQTEDGMPIGGAKINASDVCATESGADGSFVLRGFGDPVFFQLQVFKKQYGLINWSVQSGDQGLRWREVGGDRVWRGPCPTLDVVMKAVAWISGNAVDAETGEAVRLRNVVRCSFDRGPDGKLIRQGCWSGDFEQPEVGHFRVPYSVPFEYVLTVSADGYHDAEVFTPEVARLEPIEGLVARLKRRTSQSVPDVPEQRISGMILRDGRSVAGGWVGLWRPSRSRRAVNAHILRGRTAEGPPHTAAQSVIASGYCIRVPFQADDWYLVVEQPGYAPTQVGPLRVALNEKRTADITCVDGGEIGGTVKSVPAGLEGRLWVVAFNKSGIRAETRVAADGTFRVRCLPPGEYGLKVGHDAYDDAEVPRGDSIPREAFEKSADPWRRATIVRVASSRATESVELELPT